MPEIDSQDYHDFVIKDGKFIGEFEQMYQKIDDPWGTIQNVHSLKNDLLLCLIAHLSSRSEITRAFHAGCALGALTARVRDTLGRGVEIYGCDISKTAIRKAAAQHSGIHFFVHDLSLIEDMPFSPGFFDLILMAETMWYVLPWLDKIFRGFRVLLRPGGHLVIQQYFLQPGEQTYGNEIVEKPEDLLRFVVKAGFEVQHQIHLNPVQNHCYLVWATGGVRDRSRSDARCAQERSRER